MCKQDVQRRCCNAENTIKYKIDRFPVLRYVDVDLDIVSYGNRRVKATDRNYTDVRRYKDGMSLLRKSYGKGIN